MKNALLALMLYSTVVSVFLIGYVFSANKLSSALGADFSPRQKAIVGFAIGLVVAVVLAFFLLISLDINVTTNLGQVGDFVGGLLNPLLSFMALIAILLSISAQEKDIAASLDALSRQEEILKYQSFESSFFNLLTMLRERRKEFVYVGKDGRPVPLAERTAKNIRNFRKRLDARAISDRKRHSLAIDFVAKNSNVLLVGSLRRQLNTIRRFISEKGLSIEKRKYYYRVALDDFTPYESLVLVNFYISNKKNRKFIRKYGLSRQKDEYTLSPIYYRYLSNK